MFIKPWRGPFAETAAIAQVPCLRLGSPFGVTQHVWSMLGSPQVRICQRCGVCSDWPGGVCLSNRGKGRLLMKRRQSHRCLVCVWGRRSAIHRTTCGQRLNVRHDVRSALWVPSGQLGDVARHDVCSALWIFFGSVPSAQGGPGRQRKAQGGPGRPGTAGGPGAGLFHFTKCQERLGAANVKMSLYRRPISTQQNPKPRDDKGNFLRGAELEPPAARCRVDRGAAA